MGTRTGPSRLGHASDTGAALITGSGTGTGADVPGEQSTARPPRAGLPPLALGPDPVPVLLEPELPQGPEVGQQAGPPAPSGDLLLARESVVVDAFSEIALESLLEAFEFSPAPTMAFVGPDLRLVLQNSKSRRLIGDRPLGVPCRQALADYPAYVTAVEHVWRARERFVLEGGARTALAEAATPDASVLPGSVLSPLLSGAGAVIGVICQIVEQSDVAGEDERLQVAMALDRVALELGRSLEVDQVATTVTRLAAEVFAGWGILDLWQPDGSLARVALTHHDQASQSLLDRLKRFPRVSGQAKNEAEAFPVSTARTGEVVVSELDPAAVVAACADPEHASLLEALRPRWFMTVPVRVGSRRLGSLSVVRSEGERPFRAIDRAILEHFAERAAIALAHARDYDEQRNATLTLQRSLLPVAPVQAGTGLDIAVRYQPGGAGAQVGGDWYDIVALNDGRSRNGGSGPGNAGSGDTGLGDGGLGDGGLGFVVGDVEGHDLRAAALMGQVRAIVHSHAHLGLPPGRIVAEANAFVLGLGTEQLVTMTYLQLYPRERFAVMARAGHIPAIVVSPKGTVEILRGRGGLPLGITPGATWLEETRQLPAGSLLALFTDGLVETVQQDFDEGIAKLASLLSANREQPLEELADTVLREMPGDGQGHDDVAVLLVRLPAVEQVAKRVARRMPAVASSAPVARIFVSDVLAHWGADEDFAATAALLTTELVSNAARESDSSIELRAEILGSRLRISVADDSHRLPQASALDVNNTSGRGLQLVETLSVAWGVEAEAYGKAVWFELALPQT